MYYFTSDVHLGAGDEAFARRIEQRFVKWLDKVAEDADAIFLVGDIFDFWFEYGKVIPKGFARTLGKLAELTDRGVKIYFFIGCYLYKAKLFNCVSVNVFCSCKSRELCVKLFIF